MAAADSSPHNTALRTHGLIAVMSLALAALAYCAPNLFDRHGAPLLFEGSLQAIEEVRYTAGDSQTVLLCARGHVTEVQLQSGMSKMPPSPTRARYRPSPEADALLTTLAPLRSLRALGQQDDAHLQLFGLSEPNAAHLHIHSGTNDAEVTLGRPLYGTQDLYARAEPFGVVVLSGASSQAFDHGAAALWDAHILGPDRSACGKLVVRRGGKTCSYLRAVQEPNGAWFGASSTGTEPSETPAPLAGQVLSQLQTVTFVAAADAAEAALATAAPDFAFEMYQDGSSPTPRATLQIHRGHDVTVIVGSYPLEPVILGEAAAAALEEAVQELCGHS